MSSHFSITFKLLKTQLLALLLLSFSVLATNPHSKIGSIKHKEVSGFAVADYTITTTGGIVTITDVSGNSGILTVSESGSNIRFHVSGRTYQIDAGAVTAFNSTPADIALATTTSITINTAAGSDNINIGAFTLNTMPSLTINGGTGNDAVNFNGDITFAANADLDVDLQNDDTNPGVDAITIATDANLLLSGTGTATVKVSKDVLVSEGGSLETVNGNLTVEANQQAAPTAGDFKGVRVRGSLLQSTGSGLVTIKGKGGDDADGDQYGVYIQEGGKVSGGTGPLIVAGNGGNSEEDFNYGVCVYQPNSLITSSGGNVNVTGQGGGSGASSYNHGVFVQSGGVITAGSSGTVTVEGTGGATTGINNIGVALNVTTSRITSSGGNVSVTGQGGGSGASNANYGVYVNFSPEITAGGSGTVTVQGTGGATSGINNYGVVVNSTNARITSSGGNVSVTGKEGSGSAVVGIITLNTGSITTATNGGNLTLIANSMDIQSGTSVSTNTTGSLTLRPFTANTAINLGSATNPIGGPLSFSDTELDKMTVGTLIIGDANSGAITVSADITRPAATDVQLISAGDVILSGGGVNTNGGTLFLDPGTTPAAVKPTFNGTDVTASTLSFGSDLALAINGTTPGTQYDQLKVVGVVDLSGVTLKLSGTPSPALAGGETFILVDNDDSDLITGIFTGLSEGATIPDFLGSGLNATISYIGGTGNDVVITVNAASLPDFTLTKATSSTFIQGGTASYNLTVNNIGTASSAGTYTITDPLPSGLTVQSIVTGAAWNCTSSTTTQVNCISNTAISSGSSAGVVQVIVNIAANAPASITNTASVSGGGETNTSNNTGSVTSAVNALPNYTLTTTGNIVTLTDVSGNGETLTVSENGGNIRFNVTGRTYSLDGGATASFPADVPLSEKTGIVLNTANGADIINAGAFTANLPSLTVNGGTGNDAVNFNGDITFAANANLDVDLQNDDANPGVDAVNIAANANLLLSGTGTATVKVSKNVLVRGSLETVNGNLMMEANQQATPTAGSFNGVDVINAGGLLQSIGSGSVTIKGKGGDDAGGSQFGVRLILGGKINGGTGSLTVTGTGGNSEGNYNHGVHLHSSLITSSGGNVTVTGTGAGSGASIASQGVLVNVASQITAGGMGSVTVTGNGGSAATGGNNIGVLVQAPDSRITSSGGNVSVTGSGGGSASSATNAGVAVGSAGQITAEGIGTVTVTGTGGATSGNENHGVAVYHDNSLITSTGGNVTVTGLGGGSGASSNNNGIIMAAGGRITAGSTGTVTLTGTGGASSGNENIGILVSPTSQITSSGGNVSVTGKEGGGLSGYGIATQNSSSITTATNGGNITLIANSMDIQSGPISTNTGGTLTLRPFTNNTAIDLGSSTNTIGGPLSLHDTELDRMTTGTFIIGDATCGAITVSAPITRPAATNVQLISGGDVSLSGGGFNTNGGTLLLDPGTFPAAVKPTFNGTDVTASTLSFGSDLALTINGTTPGPQYDQLKVAGSIDLTGVTLLLSGTPSPAFVGGETFTIIDNDDIDAITGTFIGLPQGTIISNFLGSGFNATISYTGGTGNDAIISINPRPTAVVSGGGTVCSGDALPNVIITLTGTPPWAITYSDGTALISVPVINTSPYVIVGAQPGTYTVTTVSNADGIGTSMTGSATVSVTPKPTPVITNATICSGETYTWAANNTAYTTNQTALTITNDGCTANQVLNLTVTPKPAPVVTNATICSGTGYVWIANGQNYTTDQTALTITNDGCTANQVLNLAVLPSSTATISGTTALCQGAPAPVVTFTGSGGTAPYTFFYQVNGGATQSITTDAGNSATVSHSTASGGIFTYTLLSVSDVNCLQNLSDEIVITVYSLPTDVGLSGGGISFCGTPLSILVESSQAGVSYQLKRNNVNLGSPIQGTGGSLPFSGLTQAGTYTVVATTLVGGCSRTLSTEVPIQTRNAPNAYNLSGGGASCSGTPLSITLANSQIGVLYQLKRANNPVGSPVPGTGNALSFPPQNTPGNYTAVALTQCADLTMNNTVTITSVVTPSTFTVTGGGASCGTTLPVGLSDSQSGVFYQLYRNGSPVGTPVQGTGNPITLGNHLTQGQYTIVATRTGECPTTMSGSVSITLIDPPALFNLIGGGAACPGGVTISLSGSQIDINYQLKRGTTVVSTLPGTGNPLSFDNQTVAGTYTVEAISILPGNCSRTMSGNAIVTAAGTLPNTYSMTGGGAFCNNVPVALGLSDSQKNVYYQLQRNTPSGFVNVGTGVQGTGNALALGTHSILGEYRVVVNSACVTEMADRKSITTCPSREASESFTVGNSAGATISPNPVANILHLKVSEAKGQKVNVNLLDATGRLMLQRTFVPQTNRHQEEFEVSQLANGMYFMHVNTPDKQTTLKVVKME